MTFRGMQPKQDTDKHKATKEYDPSTTPIGAILYHQLKHCTPNTEAVIKKGMKFMEQTVCKELTRKEQFTEARSQLRAVASRVPSEYLPTVKALHSMLRDDQKDALELASAWMQEDVASAWKDILYLLEQHLPPEVWSEVKALANSVFDGDPPII